MNAQTLEALYLKIDDLTEKGVIAWKHSDETTFSVSFSRSTLELAQDYNYDPPAYHLDVRNEDGVIIAYVAEFELEQPDYGGSRVVFLKRNVEPLFLFVEKRIFKHDDTEKSLFDDLNKLEQVGKVQKKTKEPPAS